MTDSDVARFAVWFLLEVAGCWAIWASFMAVKFIIEDAQHQRAAFSVIGGAGVGFTTIPVIATIVWTVVSIAIAASR